MFCCPPPTTCCSVVKLLKERFPALGVLGWEGLRDVPRPSLCRCAVPHAVHPLAGHSAAALLSVKYTGCLCESPGTEVLPKARPDRLHARTIVLSLALPRRDVDVPLQRHCPIIRHGQTWRTHVAVVSRRTSRNLKMAPWSPYTAKDPPGSSHLNGVSYEAA